MTLKHKGYYNLDYNVKLAARMKKAGLKVYIDIHFSGKKMHPFSLFYCYNHSLDTWADPGHQTPPKGWPTDLNGLLLTVRNYTQTVVSTFAKNNINVDIISIGNEVLIHLCC